MRKCRVLALSVILLIFQVFVALFHGRVLKVNSFLVFICNRYENYISQIDDYYRGAEIWTKTVLS